MFTFFYEEFKVYSFFLGREITYRVLITPKAPDWTPEQFHFARLSYLVGYSVVILLVILNGLFIWVVLK